MIKRVLVGILLLVIAGAALWWVSGRQDATSPPSPAPETPVGAPVGAMPAIPADAFEMTVESVHDGDTLRAHVTTPNEVVGDPGSTRIRLLGVDTPEISPEPECWGAQATATLRAAYASADTDVAEKQSALADARAFAEAALTVADALELRSVHGAIEQTFSSADEPRRQRALSRVTADTTGTRAAASALPRSA